jgi:hypothetical protein
MRFAYTSVRPHRWSGAALPPEGRHDVLRQVALVHTGIGGVAVLDQDIRGPRVGRRPVHDAAEDDVGVSGTQDHGRDLTVGVAQTDRQLTFEDRDSEVNAADEARAARATTCSSLCARLDRPSNRH